MLIHKSMRLACRQVGVPRIVSKREGQLSLQVIIFAAVAVTLISAFTLWALTFLNYSVRGFHRTLAFSIAEAGVEYYRWHLSHAPFDYMDGTEEPGPYIHTYYNKEGEALGEFSLTITPPPIGSNVATVRSSGRVYADPTIEKIIQVKLDVSSLIVYAIVTHEDLLVSSSTNVYGKVHSNGGVHFDGTAHNLVTSARTSYDDPDHSGEDEFGVHTHLPPVDPSPPAAVPSRPDVFIAERQFPVPAIDFDSITADLANIKAGAQSEGRYFASSTALGYHLVLKTDDTFDLYRVTKMLKGPPGCSKPSGSHQEGWGVWSIDTEVFLSNYTFPENGLIFFEDDVWLDGQIDSARITIAAAQFPTNPSTDRSIIINKDVLYTNYDGSDVIGLIAQKNINFGLVSEDDLRIDGALVAKSGRIGRYDYRPGPSQGNGCDPYHTRMLATTYGIMASYQNIQFSYSGNTGYVTKNWLYDANLLYNTPPSFPLVGSGYVQISWDEVK